MKKQAIALLVTLLLGIFSVQAEENANTNETSNLALDTSTEYQTVKIATEVPKGIKNAIQKKLFYTEFAQNKNIEGQVYLRLTVDENNMLHIIDMNATTPYLGKQVTKQLAYTKVKKPGCKAGQVYIMRINFDILN